MPDYRLYFVKSDGQIDRAPRIVSCVDDAAAIAEASQLLGRQGAIEVWSLDRLITKLTADQIDV